MSRDRPYKGLSNDDLFKELSRQLEGIQPHPDAVEVTAFGDTERKWLVPNTVTSFGSATTLTNVYYPANSSASWDWRYGNSTVPYQIDTEYRVGRNGQPEAVTRLVEGAAKPESDMDWLKRRVREICWVPA